MKDLQKHRINSKNQNSPSALFVNFRFPQYKRIIKPVPAVGRSTVMGRTEMSVIPNGSVTLSFVI